MLTKEEFHEAVSKEGRHFILCERLDIFPNVEQELLTKTVSVKCPADISNIWKWLRLYQDHTKTTYSNYSTLPGLSDRAWVIDKKTFRCLHYARKTASSRRDTACPSMITIRIRKDKLANGRKSRSKRPDCGYALTVESNGETHNHTTTSAAALRFRRAAQPAKDRLIDLFRHHHSPATALETLKMELQAEYGDEYPLVAADRAILPDLQHVHYLHRTVFAKEFGSIKDMDTSESGSPLPEPSSTEPCPDAADPSIEEPCPTACPSEDAADRGAGPSAPPSAEQAEAADRLQTGLEELARSLGDRIRHSSDWERWARGADAFLRRWDSSTTAGQESILFGVL